MASIFTTPIESDSYIPLRVQVYRAVREAIVSGKLRPGERIVEDQICSELGVSRSPLREALRQLQGEGLVAILPRRGVVVTQLTSQDGLDLFAVREVLEGLAASQAARQITDEELTGLEEICRAMEELIPSGDLGSIAELNTRFHDAIVEASHNRWVREFLASIRAHTKQLYRSSIETAERAPQSLAEHYQIIEALKRRDEQAAEAAARLNVRMAREASPTPGSTL